MKQLDLLYFNIYNYFFNVGTCRQNFNARFQAMYLFALGAGGWLLFFQALYFHIVDERFASRSTSTIFAGSIFILAGIVCNYIFIVKDRDLKIFGKYEKLFRKTPRRGIRFMISLGVIL